MHREVVLIVQRVLPFYRAPFFAALAASLECQLVVASGEPDRTEAIQAVTSIDGVTVRTLENHRVGAWGESLWWQSNLEATLREYCIRVAVFEANPRLLSSWRAIRRLRREGVPVAGWGLGELPRPGGQCRRFVRRDIAKRFARQFTGVIAYSSKGAEDFRGCGLPPERIFVAANATNDRDATEHYEQLQTRVGWQVAWRKSLGLAADGPVVLFVGRLIEGKRLELLIDCLEALQPNVQMLLVGDGPERSGLEARALHCRHRVVFAGHRTGGDLAECFAGSDLFLLPGAGGLALQQAVTYGLPAVISVADGTEQDLLKDGENGYCVPPGDALLLATRLNSFLGDAEIRVKMRQRAREIAARSPRLSEMVASFSGALAELPRLAKQE